MTRLLLDYPWELADAFRDAAPSFALLGFVNLLRRTGLRPIPFVEYEEENAMERQVAGLRAGNSRQALMQFLHECRRPPGSTCRATPDPEPPRLRDSWKCALRDELVSHPDDWRSPQIVAPRGRRAADWPPGDEINIRCEPCGEQPASGPHQRVLAILEEYESHRFSSSDIDPWNLQRLYPPNPGAPRQYACCLPKPPMPHPVTFETLNDKLAEARDKGSRINGKYYFIPRDDWRWEDVDKGPWREGRAFPRKYSAERDQVGYCDHEGKIWIWHNGERHWDVQQGGAAYDSVNHAGDVLKTVK